MQKQTDQPAPKIITTEENVVINDKFKNLLAFMDEDNAKEAELEAERQRFDRASLGEKNRAMYTNCQQVAAQAEQAELLTTYIEQWYNPDTTKLSDENLHINLIFLRNLLRFTVLTFEFTSEPRTAAADDPKLTSDSWKPIMDEETTTTPEKYIRIADKWIRNLFYTNLFNKLHKAADTGTYNRDLYKQDMMLSEEENFTFEDGVRQYIRNRTSDNSVIISSRNTTHFFKLNEDRESYEPQDIYHQGTWDGRVVQQYDPAILLTMKNVKSSVYAIHRGETQNNLITIDSRKPLVFFDIIENPMLDQPQMMTYLNVDFDFLNTATVNIYLDDAVHV